MATLEDQSNNNPAQKFVLIDTDAGVDDAWAVFLCLRAHQDPKIPLTIVGITTTTGNTKVDNVTKNVGHVLETMGIDDIPVFRGSDSALLRPLKEEDMGYFGKDGFGDTNLPPLKINHVVSQKHAVSAMIELAQKFDGNLTILSIAPLTNLATAVRFCPGLKKMVKEIYFLGGNYQGVGNMGVAAEFNVYADPEAAQIVLDNFDSVPIHVVPWEICLFQANLGHTFRVDCLGNLKTKQMALLSKIEASTLSNSGDDWIVGDVLAAAILVENSIVQKSEKHCVAIELNGSLTRGMMVLDRRMVLGQKTPNVDIVTQIDVNLLKKWLIWTVGGP